MHQRPLISWTISISSLKTVLNQSKKVFLTTVVVKHMSNRLQSFLETLLEVMYQVVLVIVELQLEILQLHLTPVVKWYNNEN